MSSSGRNFLSARNIPASPYGMWTARSASSTTSVAFLLAFKTMATVLPPPSKRQKKEIINRTREQFVPEQVPDGAQRIQFRDADSGEAQGPIVTVTLSDLTPRNLSVLLNTLLGRNDADDQLPYRFYNPLGEGDFDQASLITAHLAGSATTETQLNIPCRAEAVFRVKAVTRCSSAVSGHGEAILCAQFSPASSSRLATGSGDNTARIWDCDTGTPYQTLTGHTGWILVVSWSPDGTRLATGGYDGTIRIWDPSTGRQQGATMKGHSKHVNALAWEPYHVQQEDRPRIASASKDFTARIWDVIGSQSDVVLTGHKSSLTSVKWGGTGLIYTASQDKTIKIWNPSDGRCTHTLNAHAHWVNHLALSTDFALRTAFFDHTGKKGVPATVAEKRAKAKERFEAALGGSAKKNGGTGAERLVSASDDCQIFVWDPSESNKPTARLNGHQNKVNHVTFSPDGLTIASAGFDNLIKLWSVPTGATSNEASASRFLFTLKGHVGPVYQIAFSADSRMLVSASKDRTVKCWDVKTGKLQEDLPGHKDEVFAVDWSPDGDRVGSAGQDKQVRIWRH